ncbi:MAG TPA: hypothetical protein VI589_13730 [Vicinamibacteria bacterium]
MTPSPPPPRSSDRLRGRVAFVSLSPADPILIVGGTVELKARLVRSDLSGFDVTEDAVWASSAPQVAFVETTPGVRGRLSALAPGIARLFASAGGKVGWTTVTVLAAQSPGDPLERVPPGADPGASGHGGPEGPTSSTAIRF